MSASYDVVIAGAGAAGAVLAARLSEDRSRSGLAAGGGPDFSAVEDLPEEIRYAYGRDRNIWDRAFGLGTRFGWEYRARATDLRPDMFVPRGKIIGGSSAVNAQIFLRGVPEDYDSWAAAGNDLWSHDALLPFLCRLESDPDYGDAPYHGANGPIRARRFKDHELNPEHRAFYEAALAAGYPDCPITTTLLPPASALGAQQRRGHPLEHQHRLSHPARGRPNLTIQANTHVHRVLFASQRATACSSSATVPYPRSTAEKSCSAAGLLARRIYSYCRASGQSRTWRRWALTWCATCPALARICATIRK